MPSRTLREGLVASDKVAQMQPAAQDRFPRYFLLADDYGCFRVQAEVIKGDIYPRRPDMTPKIVAADLVEFERVGCLTTWNTDSGHTYGFFTGWWEHNRRPRPTSRRKTPRPPHPNADPPSGTTESAVQDEPELPLGSRSLPNGALRQASAPAVRSSQFAHAEDPPVAPRQKPGGPDGTVLPLRIPKRQRPGRTLVEEKRIERDQEREQRSRVLLAEIERREHLRANPLMRGESEKLPPLLDAREAQLAWVQERCHASPEEALDAVALVQQAQEARRIPQ